MNCPGSVKLCARFPEEVESEWAAEGTAMHEAMDLILTNAVAKDRDVIGLKLNGIIIDEEMFEEGIAPALAYFDKIDDELGGIEFLNEQTVQFPGIPGAFGLTDIIGAAADRTVIVDWKFGRGVAVSAVENEQEMFYGVAAMHTPATAHFFKPDRPVELFIAQPRVNDGEPFTRWLTTPAQLEGFALELRKAVKIALEDEDPPLKMGEWCKFCSAKTMCPLFTGRAKVADQLAASEMMSALNDLLPMADAFIDLGKTIKDLAHKKLEEGAVIPGWKLVRKSQHRKWKDEPAALKWLKKMGLTLAEAYRKKILSPAQAEDTLRKAGVREVPSDLLAPKNAAGTTLAPMSDPRPPVMLAASAMQAIADRLKGK